MRPRSGLKARDVIAWGEALRAEPQVKNLSKTIAGLKGRDEFRPHRPGRSWGDGPGPPLALLASAQACVSRSRGWTLFRLSRSDRVTVAVGFSPRKRGKVGRVAERRMSEPWCRFMRRYATRGERGAFPWAEAHGSRQGIAPRCRDDDIQQRVNGVRWMHCRL